jgi:hypothetical protein
VLLSVAPTERELDSINRGEKTNLFFLNRLGGKFNRVGIEPNTKAREYCQFPVYKSYEDLSKLKKPVRVAVPGGNLGVIALIMDFEKRGIEFKAGRLKGASDASLPVMAGDAVYVPSISVVEVVYLVEKEKLPEVPRRMP